MKLNKYIIAGLIAVAVAVAVGLLQPVRENLAIKYKPYTGLDYNRQGETGEFASNGNVEKCKSMCTKKPDCVGFTINPNKTCYFKDTTISTPTVGNGTFYYGGKGLPPGVDDPTEYENIEWGEEEEEEEEEDEGDTSAPTRKPKPPQGATVVDTDTAAATGSNTGMYIGIGVGVVVLVLVVGAALVFSRPTPAPVVAGRRR
jgi:hypothetical protein